MVSNINTHQIHFLLIKSWFEHLRHIYHILIKCYSFVQQNISFDNVCKQPARTILISIWDLLLLVSIIVNVSMVLPFLSLILLIILSKGVWSTSGKNWLEICFCLSSNVLQCWSRSSSFTSIICLFFCLFWFCSNLRTSCVNSNFCFSNWNFDLSISNFNHYISKIWVFMVCLGSCVSISTDWFL